MKPLASALTDVLYAGGTPNLAAVQAMTAALAKPLNVGLAGMDPAVTVAALAGAGVKRVSTGGSMTPRGVHRNSRSSPGVEGAGNDDPSTGSGAQCRALACLRGVWTVSRVLAGPASISHPAQLYPDTGIGSPLPLP